MYYSLKRRDESWLLNCDIYVAVIVVAVSSTEIKSQAVFIPQKQMKGKLSEKKKRLPIWRSYRINLTAYICLYEDQHENSSVCTLNIQTKQLNKAQWKKRVKCVCVWSCLAGCANKINKILHIQHAFGLCAHTFRWC